MNNVKKTIFLLMVILQLGIFIAMVGSRELVIRRGSLHRFQVTGFDPYDIMRGNYLRIRLIDSYIELDNFKESVSKNDKVYIEIDDNRFTKLSKTKPNSTSFIATTNISSSGGSYYIGNLFQRYYVESSKAMELEDRLLESENSYIDVRIYNGKYVVEDIILE